MPQGFPDKAADRNDGRARNRNSALAGGADCGLEFRYQEASWKGVAFNCETSTDEFGRRGHLYEYPLGEATGYKDLGRKAKRFKLEGYLIGKDQIEKTDHMRIAAESREPGILVHPMYGRVRVACVTLAISADYRRDIKRTKLTFEFVEANEALTEVPLSTRHILQTPADNAVTESTATGEKRWTPAIPSTTAALNASSALANLLSPANDEASFDAISALQKGLPLLTQAAPASVATFSAGLTASEPAYYHPASPYQSFAAVAGPIDAGTATIRRIHADALARLRGYNRFMVLSFPQRTPSVEALVMTARLALVRDYAFRVAGTTYKTVHAALLDLDFIIAVYDEEELAAVMLCEDELTTAIRAARAGAIQVILNRNIRLPGLVTVSVEGLYPSLVAAHKHFFDGRRFLDVENYNPHMVPFFIGRGITVPAS